MFDRFRRLKESVTKTRQAVFGQVSDLFDRREVDESLWDELEELLIQADVGAPITVRVPATIVLLIRIRVVKGRSARPGWACV